MLKASLLLASLVFATPCCAGLGPAVTEAPNTINAWCGKPLNNCMITFQNGKMKVNNNEGITSDQIKMINTNRTQKDAWWPPAARNSYGFRWDVQVTYEENGKQDVATFMFVNEQGAIDLQNAIQRFAPTLRPIGPSIRIEK
jgi:hypothetical protein